MYDWKASRPRPRSGHWCDDLPICYIETLGITVLNISIKVCPSGLASYTYVWLRLQIKVTELRTNQAYVTYYNQWARLLVMGFIPAVMLIYFNYKVCIMISYLVNLRE